MKRDLQTTSRIMASIKCKDTTPEQLLGKAMWHRGMRYRKQYKIFGKPDFVFIKNKIAIFCDGDFWHGNNWRLRSFGSLEEELESYTKFWREKILKNIARDIVVNKTLEEQGWTVLRFWESEIKINIENCLKIINQSIENKSKIKNNILI